jgi:hypothetical protein
MGCSSEAPSQNSSTRSRAMLMLTRKVGEQRPRREWSPRFEDVLVSLHRSTRGRDACVHGCESKPSQHEPYRQQFRWSRWSFRESHSRTKYAHSGRDRSSCGRWAQLLAPRLVLETAPRSTALPASFLRKPAGQRKCPFGMRCGLACLNLCLSELGARPPLASMAHRAAHRANRSSVGLLPPA